MKHRSDMDSGNITVVRSITWNFNGSNPITAIPTTDSFYMGHQQLNFVDSNITQLNYYNYHSSVGDYGDLTVNFSYTSLNKIDTISFQEAYFTWVSRKTVLQYSGDQIIGAISAATSNTSDTFFWSQADLYYFTYSGSNISQIIISRYNGSAGRDSQVYKYFTDGRSNNFAGSMQTFFALEFLEGGLGETENFLLDMPYYTNTNFVDSFSYGNAAYQGASVISITDVDGRITQRISASDTTFYYY